MESGPSEIVETVVGWLVPPACREEVLGDMRERHCGSVSYLVEAAHVVPSVIYSRICRTADAVVTLMMLLATYTAFVFAAWCFEHPLLFHDTGFLRLAIPPATCVTVIIFGDAYSNPQRRWPLKPLFGPIVGLAVAGILQPTVGQWALPIHVWAWGSGTSLLLLSTLRIVIPPLVHRPKTANAPAFWQKLDVSGPSLSVKSAVAPCGLLLLIVLYLLSR